MMKMKMERGHRGWFLWIGGACFLVGSLVAGSVELASSAAPGPTVQGTVTANQGTPGSSSWPVSAAQSGNWQQEITDGTHVLGTSSNPLRTDPTGTTTQPVSGTVGLDAGSNDIGNVGISGSLPNGTNDIGTVHVAPGSSPTLGAVECSVSDGADICTGDTGLGTAGPVINTMSAYCTVKQGQHLDVELTVGAANFMVPVSYQLTVGGSPNEDVYVGTLSNLNIPVYGTPGANTMFIQQDYVATSGNGAICTLHFTMTTP